MDTTFDGFLNRQLTIEQPKLGFRIAVDTILLASAVPAKSGDLILDMGCGVGGAMLALAYRVPEVKVHGIDIQNDLVEICRRNIILNKFEQRLDVYQQSVTNITEPWGKTFDHVMMNPPFHEADKNDVSLNLNKRTSNTEIPGDLALWIKNASRVLKSTGALTLIHRADRQEEIIAHLSTEFKGLKVVSILTKQNEKPKRIIVRAYKTQFSDYVQHKPFVLHKEGGNYTEQAEDILRHAKAFDFAEDFKK